MANGKVDIGGFISEAWELYKGNFGLLCVATLIAMLLGVFTCGVLAGPLWAGLTLVILRVSRKSDPAPAVGDVFKGFDYFLQSLLYVVVLMVAGFVLGFIPMVGQIVPALLMPLVMFSMCLIVDQKMEFWPAIMASFAPPDQPALRTRRAPNAGVGCRVRRSKPRPRSAGGLARA